MDGMTEPSLTNLSLGVKITYGIIASLGIGGNGLVVYVLTHMVKSRKGSTNILIISQSVTDLTTSVLLILCFLTPEPTLPSSPTAARFLCSIWNSKYLFWATIFSSTFNLVCLNLERYYAIVRPFRYRSCRLFVWPKSLLLVILPWVLAYAYQSYFAAVHYVQDGRCMVNQFQSKAARVVYAVIILIVTYLFPFLVMVIAFIKIYKAMRAESISIICSEQMTERCSSSTVTVGPSHKPKLNDDSNERARRNIIKTLLIVSVVFGLCWAPNQVFYFYYNVSGNVHLNVTLYNITICIAFFNMCVNPFIYTFKYQRFRQGLQRALPCLGRLLRVSGADPQQESYQVQ